ncbi:MAG TPA: type II CAAX endopeptidase family protein [Candidatus Deferrimicrobiaceae bacterium]|nr:type II CAAX endopeptidase family protein [Candidatus Deferrimicrobiaceae bacterium]
MRPPGSFPIPAILLFAGIVLVLRLASRYPSPIPLFQPDLLGAALFLYAPFLYYRRGRAPTWTRLADAKQSVVFFLALGAGGALAFFLVSALPLPLFPRSPGAGVSSLGALLFRQAILVALPEEVFFRGYLYDAFEEKGWEPVTASSLLFAAGHLAIHASAYRALTFFPALAFGWARKKTGNIYVPVLLHLLYNLFPYLSGGPG